tara:strand:+ start:572 stop:1255 length:684 start_codon:yes stop_codon:yes gene_type:complete
MQTPHKNRELFLREKILNQGVTSLSDQELLAAFISSGSQKRSCLELAQDLLNTFGDLRQILNADFKSFRSIKGLGIARFSQLMAAQEICRRKAYISLVKGQKITSTTDTYSFLKRCLRDKKNEVFSAIFLDNHLKVLAYEELSKGTVNAASIYIRPLIEKVLTLNATTVILAHNHPSGHAKPSPEDRAVTSKLQKSLALVDALLLDHIIIGDDTVYSILNAKELTFF